MNSLLIVCFGGKISPVSLRLGHTCEERGCLGVSDSDRAIGCFGSTVVIGNYIVVEKTLGASLNCKKFYETSKL